MLRIASGVIDQKLGFKATAGLATGSFVVYRSRNGQTSVLFTTPTIAADPNVPGLYSLLMDEDMTLDPGHVTEHMWFNITHPDAVGFNWDEQIELFAPSAMRKNQPYNNFTFLMISSSDHVTPAVGATVTAQRSIDGGAFAACANSPASVGSGIYKINLAAADLNGDNIVLQFTATGCDAKFITVIPARA